MDNKQKVIETLEKAGKPLKGKEISELSGIEKKQVDKLIKELKVEGSIISPKNCYYDVNK
jgi:biotin operon repressor